MTTPYIPSATGTSIGGPVIDLLPTYTCRVGREWVAARPGWTFARLALARLGVR